jgi:hypothetical protein
MINNEKPVTAYNTEKQEIIGVFTSCTAASKYLYGEYWDNYKNGMVAFAARNKSRLTKTVFSFKVAIRDAKPEHIELIPLDSACYISPQYHQLLNPRQHAGFNKLPPTKQKQRCVLSAPMSLLTI